MANVLPSAGDLVYGSIYTLQESDEVALDGFEGVTIGHYTRETRHIILGNNNKRVEALVYFAHKDYEEEGTIRYEYIAR